MAKKWRGGQFAKIGGGIKKTAARTLLTLLPFAVSLCLVGALSWASYAFAVQSDLFILRQVTIEK